MNIFSHSFFLGRTLYSGPRPLIWIAYILVVCSLLGFCCCCSFSDSLYMLDISHLPYICLAKIISSSVGTLFNQVIVLLFVCFGLYVQNLNFMRSHLSILTLTSGQIEFCSDSPFLHLLPMSSSSGFNISNSKWRSLIHLDLLSVHGDRSQTGTGE